MDDFDHRLLNLKERVWELEIDQNESTMVVQEPDESQLGQPDESTLVEMSGEFPTVGSFLESSPSPYMAQLKIEEGMQVDDPLTASQATDSDRPGLYFFASSHGTPCHHCTLEEKFK